MKIEVIIYISVVVYCVACMVYITIDWRRDKKRALAKVQCDNPATHKIVIPEPIGFFYLRYIKLMIDVYEPVGWFRRFMLRWCFGFEYYKDMNKKNELK